MRQRLVIAGLLLVAGCVHGQAALPTPASLDVYIAFVPSNGGSFRAELENQTYTLPGASTATLSLGKHQITGSFSGPAFMIGFATVDEAGGVQTGSVRTIAGPSSQVRPCAITYSNTSSPETRRDFQVEFTVADNKSTSCGVPPP